MSDNDDIMFGTVIRFQRDYDVGTGREAGAEFTVGRGENQITQAEARAMTQPANDGNGPYAEVIYTPDTDEDEDDE